jgi:hypothetical protein
MSELICEEHHPVFSTSLCDKLAGHGGPHSALVKGKTDKYSSRLEWPNEYFYSEQDDADEAERMKWRASDVKRRQKLVAWNEERIGEIDVLRSEIYRIMQMLRNPGHGCVCDSQGTCAAHAGAWNELLAAEDALLRAVNEFRNASKG